MSNIISDLKELMLSIGMDEKLVQSLDPNLPLGPQGVDSLDCPAFVLALEKRYEVQISDADSLKLKTINDFAKFIGKAA
jgi:acyl carrier protein